MFFWLVIGMVCCRCGCRILWKVLVLCGDSVSVWILKFLGSRLLLSSCSSEGNR